MCDPCAVFYNSIAVLFFAATGAPLGSAVAKSRAAGCPAHTPLVSTKFTFPPRTFGANGLFRRSLSACLLQQHVSYSQIRRF
jgi:hypothetical protein